MMYKNKLLLGYEFTDSSNYTFTNLLKVSWPNGWVPKDNDNFLEFAEDILHSREQRPDVNVESLDKKFNIFQETVSLIDIFTIQMYDLIDIKSVYDINNMMYIFPFNLYSSTYFTKLDYFSKNGIYLSEKVKNDCRNGFCKILIYDIREGHGFNLDLIKSFIENQSKIHSIPIGSFAYVDCNQLTPKLQESYGSKGFCRNTFERCAVNPLDIDTYVKRVNFSKNPYVLPYHFICLNRSLRKLRIMVGNEIFNRWNDKFLWSLNKFDFDLNLFNMDINTLTPNMNYSEIEREYIKNKFEFTQEFYNSLPKKLDIEFEVNDLTLNLDLHNQAYINVVTETKFFEPDTIFFSEKIYKPIQAIQPFIVFGTAHFLKYLRDSGYKTFHPIINEEYDDIEDNTERYEAILKEIDRLSRFTHYEMVELVRQCSDICIYNYNLWKRNYRMDIQNLMFIKELHLWLEDSMSYIKHKDEPHHNTYKKYKNII